jgi:hypothetical protein
LNCAGSFDVDNFLRFRAHAITPEPTLCAAILKSPVKLSHDSKAYVGLYGTKTKPSTAESPIGVGDHIGVGTNAGNGDSQSTNVRMILDTDLVCTPRQEHAHCSGTAHVITLESMPNYAAQSIHIPVEPSSPSLPSTPLSSMLLRHANKFAARVTSLLKPTPSSAEVPIGFCIVEQEEHTIVFDATKHVVSASNQVARIPFLHGMERDRMLIRRSGYWDAFSS